MKSQPAEATTPYGLARDLHKSMSEALNVLHYSVLFLVIALIAAFFGFGGVAGTAASIAKILFVVFLVLFLVGLVTGRRRA